MIFLQPSPVAWVRGAETVDGQGFGRGAGKKDKRQGNPEDHAQNLGCLGTMRGRGERSQEVAETAVEVDGRAESWEAGAHQEVSGDGELPIDDVAEGVLLVARTAD